MRDDDNLYDILQVHPAASTEAIEGAYMRLARIYLPDAHESPEARDMLERLYAAYEVLGDPDRRAEYDRQMSQAEPEIEYTSEMIAEEWEMQDHSERTEEWERIGWEQEQEQEQARPLANPELSHSLFLVVQKDDAEAARALMLAGANPYEKFEVWDIISGSRLESSIAYAAARGRTEMVQVISDVIAQGIFDYHSF